MCHNCVLYVRHHLPLIPEDKYNELLMSCTCYPFGSHEQVLDNIKELVQKTNGTLEDCIRFSNRELDRQVQEMKDKNLWPTT